MPDATARDKLSGRYPARPGETCVVCNQATGKSDAAYFLGGQRVAVHAGDGCEGRFLMDPAKYTAPMRPNNIIMTGEQRSAAGYVWIWVGLVALATLLLAGFAAQRAARIPRGRAKALLTHEPLSCPACGHFNHPAATSCAGCHTPLRPRLEPEIRRLPDAAPGNS